VDVRYVDQIVSVDVVGPNLRIVLGEKRRWEGRIVVVPVLEIVRPMVSDIPAMFERLLAAARSAVDVPEALPCTESFGSLG